jgi:hypothetical protein
VAQQPRNRELRNSRAVAFRDLIQRSAPLRECRTLRPGRGKTHKRVVGFPATCDKAEQVRENSWEGSGFWLLFVTKSGFIVLGGERLVIGSLAWKCNLRAKTIRGSRRTFADQLLTVF